MVPAGGADEAGAAVPVPAAALRPSPSGDPSNGCASTVASARYLEARGAAVLDLVDASTLAGMFVSATGA